MREGIVICFFPGNGKNVIAVHYENDFKFPKKPKIPIIITEFGPIYINKNISIKMLVWETMRFVKGSKKVIQLFVQVGYWIEIIYPPLSLETVDTKFIQNPPRYMAKNVAHNAPFFV